MSVTHHYFVDERGNMRDLTTSTGPSPEAAKELGWRTATDTQISNYVAGWPINTAERFTIDGSPVNLGWQR